MVYSENNFISGLRKKEESAIEFAIELYLPVVKSSVNKVLYSIGNKESIEECINDVFLSVWNNIEKFSGNDSLDFKKWIYKISKFKAIDYYRKLCKNKEVTLEEWEQQTGISAEDEFVAMQDRNQLIKLINKLDSIDKTIFIMKFFWGAKSSEIAEKLGITTSAVDNRIYRSKLKLVNKLEAI